MSEIPTRNMFDISTRNITNTDRENLRQLAKKYCEAGYAPIRVLDHGYGWIVFIRSMGDLIEECSIQGFVFSSDFWEQFSQALAKECVLIHYDVYSDSVDGFKLHN